MAFATVTEEKEKDNKNKKTAYYMLQVQKERALFK